MQISVVIPLLNEQESLNELHDWLVQIMQSNHYSYEIIFVDDGSTDGSWKTIKKLAKQNTSVSGIRFFKNYGKSQALNIGFKKRRVMWLSLWMPICKTAPMKSLNCIK